MSAPNQFSNDIPGPTPPPDQRPNPNIRPTQAYQFTESELKVLKDCNRDSFFQRCLPIGTLFGFGAWYGVKTGVFKPHVKFGPTPKVVVSVIIGYFLGKLSYQSKCAEKLMQLPDSHLGNILRQRKRGGATGFQESLDSLMPFGNTNPSDIYSDVGPTDSMDLDTTRPEQRGLDDSQRPSVDNPIFDDDTQMPPIQKITTSYDELRKTNREQYQMQRSGTAYKETAIPSDIPPIRRMPKPPADSGPPKIINKYGDAME